MPAAKKKKPNPSSTEAHRRAGRRNMMFWVDPADYNLIQSAAVESGSPVSHFVAWAAIAAAKKILEKSEKAP